MHPRNWLNHTLIVLLALSLFIPLMPSAARAAQTSAAPVIFLRDGDFWSWSPQTAVLTQLTTWGYNERPILSPDGQRFAYVSWAQITVDAIAAGKPVFDIAPSNIWLWDIPTGGATRIADQPQGASYQPDDGSPGRFIVRGTPVWSPDGTQLAWAEYLVPENEYRLVAYSFNTGETRVIVPELPFPYADAGFFPMAEPEWSEAGLALVNGTINNVGEYVESLYYYDTTGNLLSQTLIGSSSSEQVWAWHWMRADDQDAIGVWHPSGKQELVEPRTTTIQDMPATPQLVAALAGADSLALSVTPTTLPDGNLAPAWTLTAPDGFQATLAFAGRAQNIALSPDGQELAYITDALYVSSGGQMVAIPGTDGIESGAETAVVWGPSTWRVGPETAEQPGDGGGVACTLQPRLAVGGYGQVTPGLPNIIRTLPRRGSGSGVVGRIPANGVFQVISGPVCDAEGRNWWEVDYEGFHGWTAEGEGTAYWLAPYSPATPAQPIVCGPTPRLQIGTSAFVLPGQPNILRDQPRRGTVSNVVGVLPGGAFFRVIAGPECDPEGRYWWQVQYQGVTGWTPEGEDSTYWVSPFGCPSSPAPRLVPGDQGRVTPGDPNTLRSAPGATNTAVSEIPGGGVFIVLSGPQCGPEGWTWWRVNYAGVTGWTAEGQNSTYWLEPFASLPPVDPGEPAACSPAPRLTTGITAYVLPGQPNTIRAQPSLNASSLGQIPGGAFFRVIAGPQCGTDGHAWWQIRYGDITGWTAEGEGISYWVSPFTCPAAPPTRLMPGIQAQVTPGDANVIRSGPGTGNSSVVIGSIPGSGIFDVIGGPQCGNDGRVWWQVRYGTTQGWTAEGDGDTYWVQPLNS
ncbi:SH3 domain-containing protein [Aggregatilinea lenta]|uniref:SH3 domain-containing protein n=1 Tax=Aggregatilinea lenta TaxID=913108 RepID=UPI000E5A1F25|nr:SH3 domain-containing protein [Aggregatilinea lenta]